MKYHAIKDLQHRISVWKSIHKTVALVPTMGALHEGHLSLVRQAKTKADRVVVSIFVNPTQFNNTEDLTKYPRTEEADCELLKEAGVDAVFLPTVEDIYGNTPRTTVTVSDLSSRWEGASRAGHFAGVATVVSILLNIVKPDIAIFGEKDFQQLRIIEQLVADLHLPVKIVRGKLVRDETGLALSSRNERLSDEGRKAALLLHESLLTMREMFRAGTTDAEVLIAAGTKILSQSKSITIDYLSVVEESTLAPVTQICSNEDRVLVCGYIENVRLLDNMRLG